MTPEAVKFFLLLLLSELEHLGPALAIGQIASKAVEALGRNPEAESSIEQR